MPLEIYQPDSLQAATKSRVKPAKFSLAIAAGKGGVGKSTLCANLALALRLKGYRVGALDADIYGPSLRRMIREDRLPYEREGKIQPALAQGIELISMAHFKQEHESSAFRAPIASQLIDQFLGEVHWHALDFLLVDLPPGTGDIILNLAQKGFFDSSLLISTPQAIATQDVNKCIDLFELVRVPIMGLVENMAFMRVDEKTFHPFGEGGVKKLAERRKYNVLANLPLCSELSTACDNGIPFVLAYPEHEITQEFFQLADCVIAASLSSVSTQHHLKRDLHAESCHDK